MHLGLQPAVETERGGGQLALHEIEQPRAVVARGLLGQREAVADAELSLEGE